MRGTADNGGVHENSGIANLAYVLTVQGGVQPQLKSDEYVIPVGVTMSQQIYYLGFTHYLGHTSDFVDARVATVQAANTLYPDNYQVVDSTGNAWTAVGVVENN
uniref:Peptidase M4 C-terminal domain-containing protein n=2 Tax=Paramoeba aestuarina TaxID=180227 RepID=A0A7S4NED8_9EUKA|mmetsp:Transcript_14991/g.23497  ORF Transcript_14991/g.23497 Transcript_14991/m.23497 type:complete len:104 (+) Transcript_14991:89-400(+)